MNYTKLFYWLAVADNARTLFGWGVAIFTTIAVIATIINIICRGKYLDSDTPESYKEDYLQTAKSSTGLRRHPAGLC